MKLHMRSGMRALLVLMLFTSLSVFAQVNVVVKGKAIGPDGKPIVGAKVEMVNKDNGRKFSMKTGKDGSFTNIGISPGKYDCTLTGPDGKVLSKADNFLADPGKEDNTLDFDLKAQQQETQAIVSGEKKVEPNKMTEEQRKQLEEAQKQQAATKEYNAKVGNLNQMLTQARADMKANNFAEAQQVMQQALQTDPTQPLLYGTLGDAQMGQKDYKGCSESYAKAVELQNSKKPEVQLTSVWNMNLGLCQARTGNIEAARASIDKAAQENPQMAETAYFNEGAILTNTGKYEDANAAFDKAIAADPTKPDPYFEKGRNLMSKATADPKTGKITPAPGTVEALQKYLELDPNGKHAGDAQAMLQGLGENIQTTLKPKKK